jgi:hypothetical protein
MRYESLLTPTYPAARSHHIDSHVPFSVHMSRRHVAGWPGSGRAAKGALKEDCTRATREARMSKSGPHEDMRAHA